MKNMSRLSMFAAMALCMAPTDGEASHAPNPRHVGADDLAADKAAMATAQTEVDAANAKLESAVGALQHDQAEYDAEQAEIAAHPVIGVLDEIEALVEGAAAGLVDSIKTAFTDLLNKARALVDAPLQVNQPVAESTVFASDSATKLEPVTGMIAAEPTMTAAAETPVP